MHRHPQAGRRRGLTERASALGATVELDSLPGWAPRSAAGRVRADLPTVPLEDVDPCHVVVATRAADRGRLVAAFRKAAQDHLTKPALPA